MKYCRWLKDSWAGIISKHDCCINSKHHSPSKVLGISALENQNIESSNGLSTTTIPVNNATTIIASHEGNNEQFIPSNSLSDSPLKQLQR